MTDKEKRLQLLESRLRMVPEATAISKAGREELRQYYTALIKREKAGHWTPEMLDGLLPRALDMLYGEEFDENPPTHSFEFMHSVDADTIRDCLVSGKKYEPPQSYYDALKAGALF